VVQGAVLDQGDRLAEVEELADLGVVQDLVGLEDVGADEQRLVVLLQQRPPVREHHRVVVDVEDLGVRLQPLHDLVRVLRRRQAGTTVQVLRDARLAGQEAAGPDQEVAVGPGQVGDLGGHGGDLAQYLAVDLEVVLAAQERVVHPGDAGPRGVHADRNRARGHLGVGHGRPRRS
jgi:hypothetical protein